MKKKKFPNKLLLISIVSILFLIGIIYFIVAIEGWSTELDEGLTRAFDYKEGGGSILVDSSGQANGTFTGNSVGIKNISSKMDYGYNFTIGNYSHIVLPTSNNYTFVIGFRSSQNETKYIISGAADLRVLTNGTVGVGLSGTVYGNQTINNSAWHLIIYSFENQTNWTTLYVDNQLALKINSVKATGNTSAHDIPRSNTGATDVAIDLFYVWNRSLSVAEVSQFWNNGEWILYSIYGDVNPLISLNSPINALNTTNRTIVFNGTGSDNFEVKNISVYINNTINQTNSSPINNTPTTFSITLPYGFWNWTIQSCDNASQCTNASVRNLTIAHSYINSVTYNITSYETANEPFYANITSNGTSISSAELIYNGTSYTATVTNTEGNNYNLSEIINIPLIVASNNENKSFNFNYTMGGIEYSTPTYNQNVSLTYFTLCNSTYSSPFLNISFKDESDLSVINATIPTSTFIYWLGSGAINKTLTYVNNSERYNYTFCATPTTKPLFVDSYIQYKQGTNYPQRIYEDNTTYNSSITNLTLYLLSSVNGIYVTFQVVNSADQVISGVTVSATREISGTDTLVGQGTTGADGGVTFWLNPDFVHDFSFTKSGFTTYETSFAPTQTGYTITLGGGGTVSSSYFKGIDYSILPTNSSLTNNSVYTFGFNLTSSFWDLTEYGFNLRLTNGTIIFGGSTSISGTQLNLNYNTTNQTKIYLDYYWLINGTYTNGTKIWIVYNTDKTQWSIATFFKDLKTYLDSGFFGIDNFGRYLIIFIVIFFTAGILTYKYGLTNPLVVSFIIFMIIFFFDVVVGIIPNLSLPSGKEIPYLLTFVSGLITTILVIKEVAT